MTIIAAITNGVDVWMGSDSYAGNGFYLLMVAKPKIWRCPLFRNGSFFSPFSAIVGTSGDFRGDAILRKMVKPEYDFSDDVSSWAFKLAEAMRVEFSHHGYAYKENEQESQGLHVLVGMNGRIFSIWDNYDVVENAEGYMAIGSGMYVALGAFHATDGLLTPEERLKVALEAAAGHNAYVRPPFHVEAA